MAKNPPSRSAEASTRTTKAGRWLLSQAADVRGMLTLSAIGQIAAILLLITQAYVLSTIIDRAFLGGHSLAQLLPMLATAAGILLARTLLAGGHTSLSGLAAARVKANLRDRLVRHLTALGPAYVQQRETGDLISVATASVDTLEAYLRDYLPQVMVAGVAPLAILFMVAPQDVLTAVVLLLTAPLIPFFMVLVGSAAKERARRQNALLSRFSGHFLDVLQGLPTLHLFNRSRFQIGVIERISHSLGDATMDVLRVAFLSALVLELVATISVAIVAVEIALRLLNGTLSFQTALFLLILAPEYYQPLRALGAKFHARLESEAAAERIREILNTPLAKHGKAPAPTEFNRIVFDHVRYRYQDRLPAVTDVSFEIQPGEQVALVGTSGSGKTTLASMLLRFAEPTAGRILIGDVPLSSLDPESWRTRVTYMPQAPFIFSGPVAENIRLGRPDATLDEVMAAAREAQADTFIRRLPQGYDTPLGERGARISGGEAQRIALARAFLTDAPLLVLDEPTDYLDPESERSIMKALERLKGERTVLMIAHRLSTVKSAGRIIVMERGRVVQTGDHESLLSVPGLYRDLIQSYSGEEL